MRNVAIIRLLCSWITLGSAAVAQASDVKKGQEDAFVPYHQHRDTRFGHDHAYPDRGSVVRDVPKAASVVNFAGVQYRFHEGVWYEPRGPAFIVVAPPIGVLVPSLPPFSTLLAQRGNVVLYGNDTFYQPRPDLGGYEVVNDPSDPAADPKEETGAAMGAAPALLGAAAEPAAPAAPTVTATPTALQETASATVAPLAARDNVPAHEAVPAPVAATADAGATRANRAFVYPKNGQSADQQARDRYECYQFGVSQTGFDPMRSGAAVGAKVGSQSEFERAQGVCLDARGYAVR